MIFGRQKIRVEGLSCGVVCVILRLAVLIQYRSVTDRQTDRQTDRHTHTQTHDDGIYTLSIASRGKNESPSGDHANLGDILHMAKQCTIFEVFEVFRLYVPEIGYLWA